MTSMLLVSTVTVTMNIVHWTKGHILRLITYICPLTTLEDSYKWQIRRQLDHWLQKASDNPTASYTCICSRASGNAEVLKWKYGNGKYRNQSIEVRRKAAYWCLVPYCVCWGLVAKEWLYPIDVRAGSWALGLQRASLSWCMWRQTQTKTNNEWANHAGSMLLMLSWQWCRCKCRHSSSPRIFANGSTSSKTTPETLANTV